MQGETICRFIPKQPDYDSIHVVNYVYEIKPQNRDIRLYIPTFRMHYAMEGEGFLYLPEKSLHIKKGDLFFVLPSVPYAIESQTLKYAYISYMGLRANSIMERLEINRNNCVFSDLEDLSDLWADAFTVSDEVMALRSESLLLYVFSMLGERFYQRAEGAKLASNTALLIRKYLDEHFPDPELTLEKVGETLAYNPKYVSTVFKKKFGIGVNQYLNTVRIQHACTLIEQGFTSVKNLAFLCGFKDPMYFSRVFKERMGVSPKWHIEEFGETR